MLVDHALGHQVHDHPNDREVDVIVATGEQVSVGLTALAIRKLGGKAQSFLGHQVKITTDSAFARARIRSIDAERVFEAFYTTKPGGMGMGLSISYGSVREHGGAIEVESEPGEYTRFRVTFPRAGPAQAAPRGPRTASRTRQEGRV